MRRTEERKGRGPGLTGQDWWGGFELRWPRPRYRILEAPEGPWGDRWQALPLQRVPLLASPPGSPWIRVGREAPVRGSPIYGSTAAPFGPSAGEVVEVFRIGWPEGGIFVAEGGVPGPLYPPLPVAGDILLDAQGVAPGDAEALLGFVNRWGLLGVGIPEAEDFGTDGVRHTGQGLEELTHWTRALHALQQRERSPIGWADLARLFEARLAGVRIGARATPGGLVPRLPLRRLLDALYLELWGLATGGKRLRRCPRCERFFIRGREDQIFCTGRCARLWHVKRWKQRQRRARTRRR